MARDRISTQHRIKPDRYRLDSALLHMSKGMHGEQLLRTRIIEFPVNKVQRYTDFCRSPTWGISWVDS